MTVGIMCRSPVARMLLAFSILVDGITGLPRESTSKSSSLN